jgi:hypothetical protein
MENPMSETEAPIHKQCTAHSGVESRQTSVIWLLGILIVINLASAGYQFVASSQVRDRMADTTTQFVKGDAKSDALRVMITALEQRLQMIEQQMQRTKP